MSSPLQPLQTKPRPAAQPVLATAQRLQRLALASAVPVTMAATPWWLDRASSVGIGCPFWALTGVPCPLCGGTRACAALVQGDWASAWAWNSGAVLVLIWLLALSLINGLEAVRGSRQSAGGMLRQPTLLCVLGASLVLPWWWRLFVG